MSSSAKAKDIWERCPEFPCGQVNSVSSGFIWIFRKAWNSLIHVLPSSPHPSSVGTKFRAHSGLTRPQVSSACPAVLLPLPPLRAGKCKTKPCRSLWIPNPKLTDFHVSSLALLAEVCRVSANTHRLIHTYYKGNGALQIPGPPCLPAQPIPGAGNDFPVSQAALQALAAEIRSLTHVSCLPITRLL